MGYWGCIMYTYSRKLEFCIYIYIGSVLCIICNFQIFSKLVRGHHILLNRFFFVKIIIDSLIPSDISYSYSFILELHNILSKKFFVQNWLVIKLKH